jgi:hypothetical protein
MGKVLTCFGCRHLLYEPNQLSTIIACKEGRSQGYNTPLGKIYPMEQCIKLSNHVKRPEHIKRVNAKKEARENDHTARRT